MRFSLAPTTPDLDILRVVSETGRWEVGIWRVMSGLRVRALVDGEVPVDYCGGKVVEQVHEVYALVTDILSALPESVSGDEVHALMPGFEQKPVHKDFRCVPRLRELAARAQAGEVLLAVAS
ncbi:hypothetical protein [Deinococcus wulumuqiensis]|uniref:hypothetical protein n=1 Tax=Deinococcus wulumuqiensis TaxID=980427 RepID=UPI002431C96C|nr:hypothetical protein [Deinococcus wulumuqiensis]